MRTQPLEVQGFKNQNDETNIQKGKPSFIRNLKRIMVPPLKRNNRFISLNSSLLKTPESTRKVSAVPMLPNLTESCISIGEAQNTKSYKKHISCSGQINRAKAKDDIRTYYSYVSSPSSESKINRNEKLMYNGGLINYQDLSEISFINENSQIITEMKPNDYTIRSRQESMRQKSMSYSHYVNHCKCNIF